MKTRTIFLAILLMFTVPVITSAQVGNLLKNKAGRVINAGAKVLSKEADKKIDSAATKEAEKAVAKSQENKARNQQEEAEQGQAADQAAEGGNAGERGNRQTQGGFNLGGIMGGGKVTSKYNESYSFNNRIYFETEMYNDKEVVKMNYFIYFSDDLPNAGFESKMVSNTEEGNVQMNSAFVFDGGNKSFIMMTDMGGMRMGIISEVPDETEAESQGQKDQGKTTITKTGKTKTIAGYKCDEFKYVEEPSGDNGFIWATKDLRLKADKRVYSKAGLSGFYGNPELENGITLAMESYNKKGELEMKQEAKEVNLGYQHSISTTGYSFRQMNFNQAGQGK